MTLLARTYALLNVGMNALFGLFDGLMAAAPAWLSLCVASALLGPVLLILFKYTSNQKAIGRARDGIKARLLAMKLFKDNIPLVLKSQVKVFGSAGLLLFHSLRPMLVMAVPFLLIMGQLSLWYQASPIEVGEETVIKARLNLAEGEAMPRVSLTPNAAVEVVVGPVRIKSKKEAYWRVRALTAGEHELEFVVGDEVAVKSFRVGEGLMPVSVKRPALDLGDVVLYPSEKPFSNDSAFKSIEVEHAEREGAVSGAGGWVITLFIVSMLSALAFKPLFNVKI